MISFQIAVRSFGWIFISSQQQLQKAGDEVKKGQTLIILEAMKMEHSCKSPIDGVVSEVLYEVGDMVGEGKPVLRFKNDQ